MNNLQFNYFCTSCTENEAYKKANCFTKYKIRKYKKGDYIVFKGEVVNNLSMLVKGDILVEIVLDSGMVIRSTPHSAPYPIGAVALFAYDNRYRVDIVATEDCEIISVTKNDIEEQIVKCRTFMRNFIAYTTSKFDIIAEHIALLTHKSLKAKIAYYIFSKSQNNTFSFDMKLGKLADKLCVERPSLSRTISQLVKEGIITYNNGSGTILNINSLKNLLE
ncbi:MAG: Crp/Fnr family transcriptional regulator [Rikenellaceae bacterium]